MSMLTESCSRSSCALAWKRAGQRCKIYARAAVAPGHGKEKLPKECTPRMTFRACLAVNVLVLCALLLSFDPLASATWKEKVLYRFQNIPDGAYPVGRIVFDTLGNLYGATAWAGADNCPGTTQCGIVYELQPPQKQGGNW